MKTKTWSIAIVAIALCVIMIFGALTYSLDPLLQYGAEGGFLTYRHYSEIYSNPGIAKNYKYNAVFLGSSMVENANVGEIDELFNCKTIKVPYSGGSSYNHKAILDVCYNSENKIEKVFWALDEYSLTTDKDTPRYPLPTYLYDDNKWNDLSYLLNLDIFYFYTIKGLIGTFTNRAEIMMKDGSWVEDESIYCAKNALSSFSYPMEENENKGELYYANTLNDNLNYNIIPFVKAHPETEFYFYMVPYSISYWYMNKQKGTLDAELYIARTAVSELLKYSNVKVYFFQNNEEIITNLDNYKDFTHFKPSINSYMAQQMYEGNCRLAEDNYNQIFDEFYAYLKDFDYDAYYQGMLE